MSCGCNKSEQVSGLFSDGELYLDTETLAGIIVGAVAADYADQVLNKVEFLAANENAREGTKVAAGFLLTQFGMPLMDGVGYGMMAVGGARLIKNLLKKGDSVDGIMFPGQEGTQPNNLYGITMPGQEGTEPNNVFGIGKKKEKTVVNML